jgi:hypothetical protein
VDMTPVAKHMAMTNLLNFIRRLLKVWIKEIRTKIYLYCIMKLM